MGRGGKERMCSENGETVKDLCGGEVGVFCRGPAQIGSVVCGERGLRRASAVVGGCAMVVARARRFRGMRRHRGEGGEQGSENLGACRMQREICRPPQARWRLYLFRFHAEPKFRYRRSESAAAGTEPNRPALYSPSR